MLVKLFYWIDKINSIRNNVIVHLYIYTIFFWQEVTHQRSLLGKGEFCLHGHDHNEGEEAEDVKEARTKAGDVRLVKEGADEVTEGQDAQTIIAKVQEKEEAVTVGQNSAVLQHHCEEEDGKHQVSGALQEPSEEVAERVDSHHFHVL